MSAGGNTPIFDRHDVGFTPALATSLQSHKQDLLGNVSRRKHSDDSVTSRGQLSDISGSEDNPSSRESSTFLRDIHHGVSLCSTRIRSRERLLGVSSVSMAKSLDKNYGIPKVVHQPTSIVLTTDDGQVTTFKSDTHIPLKKPDITDFGQLNKHPTSIQKNYKKCLRERYLKSQSSSSTDRSSSDMHQQAYKDIHTPVDSEEISSLKLSELLPLSSSVEPQSFVMIPMLSEDTGDFMEYQKSPAPPIKMSALPTATDPNDLTNSQHVPGKETFRPSPQHEQSHQDLPFSVPRKQSPFLTPHEKPKSRKLGEHRLHSENDVHVCLCQVCGQLFASDDDLAKHMVKHLPAETIRPGANKNIHFCKICNRSFSRSEKLTRHMRLHTRLKQYECSDCGQVFSRSNHLNTHKRTHTSEKPYKCPLCFYASCERDMITRHLRTHHKKSSKRKDLPVHEGQCDMRKRSAISPEKYFKSAIDSLDVDSPTGQGSLNRGDSSEKHMSVSRGDSSKKNLSISKGDSSRKNPSISRGDSSEKQLSVSRGDSSEKNLSISRGAGSEKNMSISRGDSSEKKLSVSRGESSRKKLSISKGDSSEKNLSISRSDSSEKQLSIFRGESSEKNLPVSRGDSSRKNLSISRGNISEKNLSISRGDNSGKNLSIADSSEKNLSIPKGDNSGKNRSNSDSSEKNLSISRNDSGVSLWESSTSESTDQTALQPQ